MIFLTIYFLYTEHWEGEEIQSDFLCSFSWRNWSKSFIYWIRWWCKAGFNKHQLVETLSTHHDIFPLYLLSDLILYNKKNNWSIWYRGIDGKASTWRRVEHVFEANATNHNSSLQITTTSKGVIWLDQISAMPLDTYKVCWSDFY
jgi:hypothetical protein